MGQAPKQVIILAAGRGIQAHGMAKCLIRHPVSRRTVIEQAMVAFRGRRIIVVVGFRAIQIMAAYPSLDYVINDAWADTHNAMSLGLALSDEPTYIIPGDVFLEPELVDELDAGPPELALVSGRENRIPGAIHAVLRDDETLAETYQGAVRNMAHPELLGMFKASSLKFLQAWKQSSIRNGHQFAGVSLPCDVVPIKAHPIGRHLYDEINTPADYLRLIERMRQQ